MSEQSIASRLKQRGLKVTKARLAILALLDGGAHLSVDAIRAALAQKGQRIGIATIYRTLSQLEEEALIEKHHFADNKAWYEACTPHHHDHMICNRCGVVIEFCDEVIEAQQIKVAKAHGFTLASHQLLLFGTCQACSKSND